LILCLTNLRFKGDIMSVVTISGQAGSGYTEFGNRLAKTIGYKLVDRDIFVAVLKQYGVVDIKELLDTPPSIFEKLGGSRQETIGLLNKMYLCFAKQDKVVIVSRRAYLVLYKYINVLNVFLESPLEDRIKNVVKKRQVSVAESEKIVRYEENVRIKLIESFYHEKWDSFLPFSLVVNTHKIGFDLTENIIVEAACRLGTQDHHIKMQKAEAYSNIQDIETDPVLEAVVQKVLSEREYQKD